MELRTIVCLFCTCAFKVDYWSIVPCPECGAEYDYDDDGYIEWEIPIDGDALKIYQWCTDHDDKAWNRIMRGVGEV